MFLSTLTTDQKQAFICLEHNVVVSDGDLSISEEVMMAEMRREMNLEPTFQPEYVDIEGIERVFDTRRSRAIALISLVRLGYADGAFEIEEECFLRELSHQFAITDDEFGLIDNWVKRLISLEREVNAFM